MKLTTTRLCAWCGLAATVIWVLGFFVISGFVPAPSPNDSAEEVARTFQDDHQRIRAGLALTCVGAGLVVPWTVGITIVMKRIEGRYAPMAWTNLALGLLLIVEFCIPIFFWQVAAYRQERSVESIQMLNDMGWIPFMGMVFSVIWQGLAIAIVIFMDKREKPLFPRWVAYVNIWFVMTMIPGIFLVFFKDGPFAWNGVLTFWVAMVGYVTWTIVMSIMVIKATYLIEQEDSAIGLQAENEDLEAIRRVELLNVEVDALRSELRESRQPI